MIFKEAFLARLAGPYKKSPGVTEDNHVLYWSGCSVSRHELEKGLNRIEAHSIIALANFMGFIGYSSLP